MYSNHKGMLLKLADVTMFEIEQIEQIEHALPPVHNQHKSDRVENLIQENSEDIHGLQGFGDGQANVER